jgi:aryl-alcohol dehydrogenase-like predicted oxidoreductase
MYRLTLGRSGQTVSALGLGCVGMSQAYGPADESQSMETMQCALDQGIDLFDTSDLYGVGHNEELIGRFLKKAGRQRVFLATKFGSIPAGADGMPGVDNSPEHIHKACDASLKRLGIEVIDLYYMHRRDPKVPMAESVGAMARLVEAGKVRFLGLSEVSAATLRQAHAVHPIAALQSEYSLWFRDPEDDVLPACRELGISFVPFSPLGRAFLTGTVPTGDFGSKDIRASLPRFKGDAAEHNRRLVDQLVAFAKGRGATAAQIALAWLLSKNDGKSSVIPIPGTKRIKYLIENAAAANVKLSAQDIAYLENLFARDAVQGDRYSPIEAARAGT